MKAFGFTLTRTKAANGLQVVNDRRGWWRIIGESFPGAFQQDVVVRLENVLTHPTVFACITLIASDIGKLGLCLKEETDDDIWEDVEVAAFSPVLRTPNRYQTWGKFIESWLFSKLIWGNAYILKERDQRGVVVAMYVLDPSRVQVLVSEDGAVYYDLMRDTVSALPRDHIVAPAREIIHDPMYTFYHPLVGLPPLHASGLLATLGLRIVTQSANFFGNGSNPGAILTAPAGITQPDADALKANWETAFSGDNAGKVAVIGGDLKYTPLNIPADKSQLSEQWTKTSEAIATTFHVPFHLVGGPPPPYNNIQALTVQYFTQCLQALCTQIEDALDHGLGLGRDFGNRYGVEFDIDDLLWMDSLTMMQVIKDGVSAGVFAPNEGRQMRNLAPVTGGDSPYLQNQMWPLKDLVNRPVAPPAPALPSAPAADALPAAPTKEQHLPEHDLRLRYKARLAA